MSALAYGIGIVPDQEQLLHRGLTRWHALAVIDAQKLTGTIILLPLVNVRSFERKVPHVNPIDRKSMSRFHPGSSDGTQTERASWPIAREVIEKAD